MKRLIIGPLAFFLSVSGLNAMDLISPNGKIKVVVELKNKENIYNKKTGQPYFKVLYTNGQKSIEVLPFSQLGLIRNDQTFSDNLTFISETNLVSILDNYEMVHGKRKHCENFGNEKTFRFRNSENKNIDIVFRAYNNGAAFRYSFSDCPDYTVRVLDELTTYSIPEGTKRWMQTYDISYEGYFPLNKDGRSSKREQEWAYPALLKAKDSLYILISEADITRANYASKLSNKENLNQYKVSLPGPRKDYRKAGAEFQLSWKSPWRVVMIGFLSDIIESTLITDLSQPSKLKETDWIKPGPVSWIYWANNHGSKDYQKTTEYIDLAVEMKWPYVLIDWEWDVMANGGNIEDACKYAQSKGIKPLMWYNSGTAWLDPTPVDHLVSAEKRAKEFSWLNKIGVYGIKVDFFAGDQQDMIQYYIDILEDAAKYHLMVNFHGATIPRGWQRTYANLMTTEGVLGAEWYNNGPEFTTRSASHNATLPFTRNVIGPMDYTPVTFTNSQNPHITTYAHELALSVLFESALQHFADRPSGYLTLPETPKMFLMHVPVAWDDTKLIDGYPADRIMMARRKGNVWYLGGINGTDIGKNMVVDLSFLTKGTSYQLKLIKDGADDKSFETKSIKVTCGDKIEVMCLPRGGFVGIIE